MLMQGFSVGSTLGGSNSPSLFGTSLCGLGWSTRPAGSNEHYKLRVRYSILGMVLNFSSLPHLIMAGVAPFTPSTPWVTITTTSFGARGISVSSNSVSIVLQKAPSAGAGKISTRLLSTGILVPQVRGSTSSCPNSPRHYATVGPSAYPTGLLIGFQIKTTVSRNFARLVSAAALSFFYYPWPVAAASSGTLISSHGQVLVLHHPLVLVSSIT